MTLCPVCGAAINGRNCAKCGTSVSGGTATAAASTGLSENVAGALCYAFGLITGIAFLAIAPYNQNPRTRFHAFQSIFFNAAMIAASIVFMIVGMILPGPLAMLIGLLNMAVGLVALAGWLFLMWKAYQNDMFLLPVVGELAKKQAGL
jgi:uncharacterized membrane protein